MVLQPGKNEYICLAYSLSVLKNCEENNQDKIGDYYVVSVTTLFLEIF